ncbi:phosphoribosyltransferase-like protein [Micromonospora sicca]|uniref:phosphoribosyltransferase-like protein n=1 Tax=Micromonospora sicca TaxID=2202420 RepID=UPI0011B6FFCA|nr:hypothetical protein [Micromonospora sp. 4G51]
MKSTMRPSETPTGTRWLSNFTPEDRPAASLLVNSLHFVSADMFRVELVTFLAERLASGEIERPAALFSVKPTRPHDVMFEKEPESPAVSGGSSALDVVTPTVWSGAGEAGSEYLVQNILRDVRRLSPGTVFDRATSLEYLRSKRVRSLVFVGDYSGSGEEACKYAAAWARNCHIRSWRSLHLVNIHLVLFAASSFGLGKIRRSGYIDHVWPALYGVDFAAAHWADSERQAIRDLCVRYAHHPHEAWGRSSSGGLFVLPHTVPNNLPVILRQTKGPATGGHRPWAPLFRGRIFPVELQAELSGYRPQYDLNKVLAELGQLRLARARPKHGQERKAADAMLAPMPRSLS